MSSVAPTLSNSDRLAGVLGGATLSSLARHTVSALFFGFLFWEPALTLLRDWWNNPDAGHGLLLAPLAIYLAWRRGLASDTRPQPVLGLTLLAGAILPRIAS